ncbi:cupin domain-containing protein [Demequina muriae]|uniref:Cupin domain-containing protein n=1 Tax=Demequina muriae TaxID=3051664 RepID=A0ABT8GDR4_9MICO|nr:cupin domain-containing protein [Demequina sp. EGI L300058]MDN4479562.1 cupin domain-containing protein [Demequina sp. EGI L300058]
MEIVDLESLVSEQLALAYEESSGRHAVTLVGDHDHDLRQTLIAIAGGNRLNEHDSPGEATLQVLRGEATLTVGEHELAMSAGDHLALPPARHGLTAVTDCAVLLTVATRGER